MFLLTLLVVAAYANSFGNGFASDDHFIIVKNHLITDLRQVPSLYIKDYWASMRDPNEAVPPPTTGLYRPLVLLLALGNRAWALEGLGRLEEAAEGYERVLEKNPGFSDLRFRLDRLRGRLALERAR